MSNFAPAHVNRLGGGLGLGSSLGLSGGVVLGLSATAQLGVALLGLLEGGLEKICV